jgi:hypothetical protein
MVLNRTLYSVEVSETDRNREYWATRTGITAETIAAIRSADLVVVPWENFREGQSSLFPQGSARHIKVLQQALPERKIAIAVEPIAYQEIALHAREWRWPRTTTTIRS